MCEIVPLFPAEAEVGALTIPGCDRVPANQALFVCGAREALAFRVTAIAKSPEAAAAYMAVHPDQWVFLAVGSTLLLVSKTDPGHP